MGKTLLELLDTFPFEPKFNPNLEKKGMLTPDPESAFDTNIKQSKEWLKATPKLYGTDIIRIMSQGQVDTKKIKKAAVKIASNVVSKIPIVGGVAGGAISQLTNPKLPGDLYTGISESEPKQMINSLYTDLLFGRVRNDKGTLGNFLKDNTSLNNIGQNLKNAAVSAAIGGATKLVSAGLDALINKKKLTLKKKELPAVKAPVGIANNDNFPSTIAFQSGVTDRIAVNQFQFTRRGFFGGAIEAGFELGKEQSKIKITKLSNNPTQDGLKKIASNRLNDFYTSEYKRFESKLDGFVPSFNLWQANDGKNGKRYNYSIVNAPGSSVYDPLAGKFPPYTLSQRYGATDDNLLTIRLVKKGSKEKLNVLGTDPFDKTGRYFRWAPMETSYTKDFIKYKNHSVYTKGEKYEKEIKTDDDIKLYNIGGLSQYFGADKTNLIQIVSTSVDYKFDLQTQDASHDSIGPIKGDNGDKVYTYTKSELDILNIESEEKSRFISGSVKAGDNTNLLSGSSKTIPNKRIGQQIAGKWLGTDIDTKDETDYQFSYTTTTGTGAVARWNTSKAKFSSNIDTIMPRIASKLSDNSQGALRDSGAETINPYLLLKHDVLVNNDPDALEISIGGIQFITTLKGLTDKLSSNWDSVKPVGSGVNFYMFNNWERDISFDLTLYAENKLELAAIWAKVNKLNAFTLGYPSGKDAGYGVYGKIVNLVIGDLINESGFLSSVSMAVDDSVSWDMDAGNQLPFVCTISIDYKVVTAKEGANYSFYGK
jgi:hypothetical protein